MRVVLRDLWQRGITKRQDLLPMSGGCLRVCKLFILASANRHTYFKFVYELLNSYYYYTNIVPKNLCQNITNSMIDLQYLSQY